MKKIFAIIIPLCLIVCMGCSSDDSPAADTESPSAPANLTASNVTETSADLSWNASSDNSSDIVYTLYQDETVLADNVSETTFQVTGLTEANSYEFYVTAKDESGNVSNASNTVSVVTPLVFKTHLSQMGVFSGSLVDLTPADDVQLYELNSTLFTDYAKKQRLVRLPEGQKMRYNGNDLQPIFPDNTLVSKTFYYLNDETDPNSGKRIIETRIFLKVNGTWQAGNYLWNEGMTEATYTENGSNVPISYIDGDGDTQNISYEVPSQQDCFTCHNNNGTTRPIGMKLRSMNFVPSYTNQNQIDFLLGNGFLEGVTSSEVSTLPDWTDTNNDIFARGRAYIDINCAHCHQPGGAVNNFNLDFRFETPFEDTAIYANRGEIEARIQSTVPTYMMPQLGRTVVHEEAVTMLLEYLQAIED
ncbi:fibronectin type III domain-containing protein [Luteirhabdus pelagi]|uniref:fibronectin type III domain-containing protein n=1 Tax=Luteirhabdus pelagi TaxID=2792783 RepID=UPI001939FB8F|nr:fibronectin type III domain-containing protein [Luteirhabdus pelagi]